MAENPKPARKEDSPSASSVEEEAPEDDEVEERERAVTRRIRALERRKRLAELELQERELESDMARLAMKKKGGRSRSRRRSSSSDRHHRRHHRHHRRSPTSSSSSGRSASRERRLRSKWSIRRYLEDRKDLKKLSPFELIESSCSWVLDKKDIDVQDLRRVVKHIKYISGRAKSGQFQDRAHASYDLAIRKLATTDGYEAFGAGNAEVALQYYAFEYMRGHSSKGAYGGVKNSHANTNTKQLFSKDGKKPCFAYNKEEGCTRDDKTCNFGHWCSRCGSRTHVRAKCRKD